MNPQENSQEFSQLPFQSLILKTQFPLQSYKYPPVNCHRKLIDSDGESDSGEDRKNTAAAIELVTSIRSEITPITQNTSPIFNQFDERFDRRNFLLKRSYSFGFERHIRSERLVIEPATTSPWRYRRGSGGSFWNKRSSPFLILKETPASISSSTSYQTRHQTILSTAYNHHGLTIGQTELLHSSDLAP